MCKLLLGFSSTRWPGRKALEVLCVFWWEATPWLILWSCPPNTSPILTLQRWCLRLTTSNLRPHLLRLTELSSTSCDFLCSQYFSSHVLLFPHLSSAFFSQRCPDWTQPAFILLVSVLCHVLRARQRCCSCFGSGCSYTNFYRTEKAAAVVPALLFQGAQNSQTKAVQNTGGST